MTDPRDDDRTIIRPAPGGRPRAAPPSSAPPPDAAPPPGTEDLGLGAGKLIAAASPLLSLLARLGGRIRPPSGGDLRSRAVAELRSFEREAEAAGVEPTQIARARALLCAALDDAVLATPWGSAGAWAARPMLATFGIGEDRFFEILREAGEAPAGDEELLELGHLCLSLGYAGRFRNSPRAAATLDRVRTELHARIAARRSAPGRLAPRAAGAAVPLAASRVRVPVWVAAVAACAVLAFAFLLAAFDGEARSDRLVSVMLAAPPAHMPAIERAARVAPVQVAAEGPPSAADRLRALVERAGLAARVGVGGTPAAPVLVIADADLFASGATLSGAGAALLAALGRGMAATSRAFDVVGYADAHAPRTAAFRSPFALSAARARAAARALAAGLGARARLRVEGRGDADPVVAVPGAAGPSPRNSRIELVPDPG